MAVQLHTRLATPVFVCIALVALFHTPSGVSAASSPSTEQVNRTCLDHWKNNQYQPDGWFEITPANETFVVYCDIYNGGWTKIEPLVYDYVSERLMDMPDQIENPDDFPILYAEFAQWGPPPQYLPLNLTYNMTTERIDAIRALSTKAKQQVYFHCKATQAEATYGCTVDPAFHPTHEAWWKDRNWNQITPVVLNDGCCFGCCRNTPTWQKSLITFTQLHQLPILNVYVLYSGGPGEFYLLEPAPVWFM